MMRILLIVFLIHGLVPGFGELIETFVHFAGTGHFAHTEGEPHDEGALPAEHGCGPTSHHCRCCTSAPVLAMAQFAVERGAEACSAASPCVAHSSPSGYVSALFRPPIAQLS